MFKDKLNDSIRIVKKDGSCTNKMMALVTKGKVYLLNSNVQVNTGDVVERYLSNGAVEKYEVLDPCFYEKQGSIPAHYQMKVRNLAVSRNERSSQSVNYHIQGDNNRIVSNSTDNSTNLIVKSDKLKVIELFEEMKKKVSSSSEMSDSKKREANELIEAAETQIKTGSSSKTVMQAPLEKLRDVAVLTSLVDKVINLFN